VSERAVTSGGMPPVLMYHSVEPYESDPYRVTVSPRRFAAQLRWLRRAGLRGVSMGELLEARRTGRDAGLIGLTFDDGYADFLTHALPALQEHEFGATVFVLPGVFGGDNAWDTPGPRKALMTADDVRATAAAGMEIASHGLTHKRLPDCADKVLADEVSASRELLGDVLGQDVAGFCYPYGHYGAREIEAVRAAGYDYACSVYPSTSDGRFALPRQFVGDRDGLVRLGAKWARFTLRQRRGGVR
jgi:peptidoglycan/xylan/chitin deacetylase (PgdA/CDA1 family)